MWGRGWGPSGAGTPRSLPGLSRAQGDCAGMGGTQAWQFSISFRLGFSEPCSDWGAGGGESRDGQAWREWSCLLQALVGGEASSALRSNEKICQNVACTVAVTFHMPPAWAVKQVLFPHMVSFLQPPTLLPTFFLMASGAGTSIRFAGGGKGHTPPCNPEPAPVASPGTATCTSTN